MLSVVQDDAGALPHFAAEYANPAYYSELRIWFMVSISFC